jgi:hypothetical protein
LELLQALPAAAPQAEYRAAVVDDNLLGRPTDAGRVRTFRHLRELYLLNPEAPEFRALRHYLAFEQDAGPLLAGILATQRDEVLRASFDAVGAAAPGDVVTSADLLVAVRHQLDGMSQATFAKCGRNTGACWTQTGHLRGRGIKVRTFVEPRPAAIAFAAWLGHHFGQRGASVLDNPWSRLLDLPKDDDGIRLKALQTANAFGLLQLLRAGNVVDVQFPDFGEEPV